MLYNQQILCFNFYLRILIINNYFVQLSLCDWVEIPQITKAKVKFPTQQYSYHNPIVTPVKFTVTSTSFSGVNFHQQQHIQDGEHFEKFKPTTSTRQQIIKPEDTRERILDSPKATLPTIRATEASLVGTSSRATVSDKETKYLNDDDDDFEYIIDVEPSSDTDDDENDENFATVTDSNSSLFDAESADNLFTVKNQENSRLNNESSESIFSLSNLMPLITTVQKTLTENIERKSQNTIESKVKLLEDIRDEIMSNIYSRLNELWGSNRQRRQIQRTFKDRDHYGEHDHHYEDDGHHVDFPSNAAALLALSFLTFAVFLIKLVLQVIHALQLKTQNMTAATTSATLVRLKRSEQEESAQEAYRILQLMETFSFN